MIGIEKMLKKEIPIVSVIVPVYNVEQYLNDSLNSLVNQTIFEKMEIVLVNDGSSDESRKICEKFEDKYNNIKLINQQNQGVACARNVGVRKSKGKYIAFFDADDLVEKDMYEHLLYLINIHKADIAMVDYSMEFNDGQLKKHRKDIIKKWNSSEEAIISFLSGEVIGNNVVDKMFAREIVENIEFPSGYSIGEDMYFVYKALEYSKVIIADLRQSKYVYVYRENSAMHNKFQTKYFDTIELSNKILENYKQCDKVYPYAKAHLLHEQCKVIEYMSKSELDEKMENKKKKLLMTIKKKENILYIKYLTVRQRCGLILMVISPKLYMLFYKIMKIG